ncbi:hypothetical protein [Nocardioides marmotae]|uniref:hypothetical protein n=1 Tax=Nocardioides marmotae TaxID=2663857 RepID=UPI0012B5C8F3|nr:hypothetical protein [Nocardioides marmotae]MBC9735171.1 hypothetical protein [Nocardioides marmotae]MTB86271.1 hypothetical protein [Nocardioides marmotae]
MSRTHVALAATLAAVTAAVVALMPAPAGAAADDPVLIRPAALARGADPAFPALVGSTIVDGDRRVRIDLPDARLLGRAGGAYVVAFTPANGTHQRVTRVRPDGSRRVLLRGRGWNDAHLSADGDHLLTGQFLGRPGRPGRTVLRALDPRSGELLVQRTLAGARDVLDARDGVALVSGDGVRPTVRWDLTAGTIRTLTGSDVYLADLAADRMAAWTRDPYLGGCSVVTSISDPGRVWWRSCQWRVEAVAPDGGRLAVVPPLSDGLGTSTVQARAVRGRRLATYDIGGWFGQVRFETATDLVLDAHGRVRTALVRCDGADCERASRTVSTRRP